jgi:2-amino-4-hydroxy-6-hydroxymethyldihydropteridine diphosphokinase/dihydropteroate synthase
MIILGLGSNQGDRIHYLRLAKQTLAQHPAIDVLQVSPIYRSQALLKDNAPPTWQADYLNAALNIKTTLRPHELLQATKHIEQQIGRAKTSPSWSPRVIDIDLLAWDEHIFQDQQLHIPHEALHERPFALWPLADLCPDWIYPLPGPHQGQSAHALCETWGSRFDQSAPLRCHQIKQSLDQTQLVGILNLSPESFSDGQTWPNTETILTRALDLIDQGAEVIDIGAQATSQHIWQTDAQATPQGTEWQRLKPVITALQDAMKNHPLAAKISIDTYHPHTAEKAIEHGADWINDVSGLTQEAMRQIVAQSQVKAVMMHHISIPPTPKQQLPTHAPAHRQIIHWFQHQLRTLSKAGIKPEQIILDPGIGFGKNARQNLACIQHAKQFKSLGYPVLFGHSRKSFLSQFNLESPQARDLATLTCSRQLRQQGIDYLRIHQVANHSEDERIEQGLRAYRTATTTRQSSSSTAKMRSEAF